ncbi:hypothetical protein RV11_GL002313 [Enterococcus phoeniculicola]|jgi:predicted DNA-binding protein (MmcQ/YjbR family)|uniref:MmcQ/YjbR family DNA-binding protein n=1 Tax=Enterococcus phoeniculicola ATCC BAA-412 TaxID=1158610 RepID=R3U6Z2_9ENTE|nr:MmcQ/YjbR family DNA-binding protein [Enterococcus phoeniculicola]EOL49218.1 hypothetical protein UC3_00121 [Enterococcus phoeniculicola ATCC BAA-412]EOT71364.1 hypothetical protein I589_03369 [Enterococcus phoeniculicola ATCC BAA-412]OJG69653.1 hypothetical protein RV11_GL002313 [Enterococcus phoeniculicola]
MITRDELIESITEIFNSQPEYPFKKFPTYAVFRHKRNKKWFAIITDVAKEKIGLSGKEKIDIIGIKLNSDLIALLLTKEGYFPAYHMNKEHWVSISLEAVTKKELLQWVEESYLLTK